MAEDKGKFPPRTIRVGDDLWIPAREKADRRGDNLSGIIRDAIRKYLKQPE